MSTTRIGKIARLPKHIRDELGCRLEDGEEGKDLVKWLNGLPAVQDILKEKFGGRAVTEQNLSEWRQGGYPEWLRQQEAHSVVTRLTEQSEALECAADEQLISDQFAVVLAAELTRLATAMLEKETDPEKRWQRLCEVQRELSQLRRDDHRAARTFMECQNWMRKTEREDEEADKRREKELKERGLAPFEAKLRLEAMTMVCGGGDLGHDAAAVMLEIQHGLRPGTLGRKSAAGQSRLASERPNSTESDPIKPNQTSLPEGQRPVAGRPDDRN